MSRILYLQRHAKSSWADDTLTDHQRPLNGRGRTACKSLAKLWQDAGIQPDMVLCSDAVRTRETFERIAKRLETVPPVVYEPGLYLAEPEAILGIVAQQPAKFKRLMVVGHNPGLEELAQLVIGDGDPTLVGRLVDKFPTGALATLEFGKARGWRDLKPRSARLAAYVIPAELED